MNKNTSTVPYNMYILYELIKFKNKNLFFNVYNYNPIVWIGNYLYYTVIHEFKIKWSSLGILTQYDLWLNLSI